VRVRDGGRALALVALAESSVDWPRHHVIERDTVLVAGQLSNEVVSLTLDERTGVVGRVRRRIEAPSPTRLLADRG
ncbi:MAG: beta-propeller fold lactonase family protein, partial [Microbacterium sp.]